MAFCRLILKRGVVASTARSVFNFRPPSTSLLPTIRPRGFFTGTDDMSFSSLMEWKGKSFTVESYFAYDLANGVLYGLPHTFRTTTRVVSEGLKIPLNEEDPEVSSFLGEDLRFTVHFPGIEKMKKTNEGLSVFIDLGLYRKFLINDFDRQYVEAKISRKLNALLIRGYVQKQDIRRDYTAVVDLPADISKRITAVKHRIKTEIKDGGLTVTVPWKQDMAIGHILRRLVFPIWRS